MKYLIYGHRSVTPLVAVLHGLIWRALSRLLTPVLARLRVRRNWRRVVLWMMIFASLVIQGIMLYLLQQLIDLSIDLMEVWAELAAKHLEIQLDRS